MGTKSRETIYGASIRAAAERAAETRKDADRLACEAWNKRMLGFQGPPQPSPALGGALNAGYRYLEVKCLGCNTHQTVALDIVRRPKTTAVHELERYMRCKDCSQVRGYPYKRSHLVRCARPRSRHAIRLDVVAGGAVSDFLSFVQSPDPTDPITTWTDTRQISCIPTACRFDAAIPVQKPAFLKLIVSALAPSKDATFPPMRAAGTCRNALLVLDRLQSLATLVLKQNRRSEATAIERSCNECRALRLIEGHEVNSGTQFYLFAHEIWAFE